MSKKSNVAIALAVGIGGPVLAAVLAAAVDNMMRSSPPEVDRPSLEPATVEEDAPDPIDGFQIETRERTFNVDFWNDFCSGPRNINWRINADEGWQIFDFLDAEPRLDYVVAMAKNAVLQRHAESAMQVARAQSEVGGETAHVYTDTRYAAGTWDHERRVVIKAEVVRLGDREPRDNRGSW